MRASLSCIAPRSVTSLLFKTPATRRRFATAAAMATFDSIGVRNRTINMAPGRWLNEERQLLVGSVLDLFEGNPTLKHLSLWQPTATFKDNLAVEEGFDFYAAQWYGLPTLFHPINIIAHKVISAGNPIEFTMKNSYTIRGIKKEHVINSVVAIYIEWDGKIKKVEDRWNDSLPEEGGITEMLRKLNANVAARLVKVPRNEEEDRKMQEERDKA